MAAREGGGQEYCNGVAIRSGRISFLGKLDWTEINSFELIINFKKKKKNMKETLNFVSLFFREDKIRYVGVRLE